MVLKHRHHWDIDWAFRDGIAFCTTCGIAKCPYCRKTWPESTKDTTIKTHLEHCGG